MDSRQHRWTGGRRVRAAIGLLLAIAFCVQCHQLAVTDAPETTARIERAPSNVAYASIREPKLSGDHFEAMAQSNPMELLRTALDRYERSVHDYVCTFTKQELVNGRLTAEQVTHVKFRDEPFSVNMYWTKNADKAQRVIYVEGKWTDKNGQKLALVEPAGAIARLLVTHVMRPIDGAEAKATARRQIDQFGFENSLRLILKYCELAAPRKELNLKYVGQGSVSDRPTYVLERRLPYTGDDGRYPDRVLVIHLDKEYLYPTCCVAYADDEKQVLLGRYVLTDVKFNVGLTDKDFAPQETTK